MSAGDENAKTHRFENGENPTSARERTTLFRNRISIVARYLTISVFRDCELGRLSIAATIVGQFARAKDRQILCSKNRRDDTEIIQRSVYTLQLKKK